MPRRCLMLLMLLVLAACDTKTNSPPPDLAQGGRAAMDKAKGVGQVLQQSADQRRQEEKKQE